MEYLAYLADNMETGPVDQRWEVDLRSVTEVDVPEQPNTNTPLQVKVLQEKSRIVSITQVESN